MRVAPGAAAVALRPEKIQVSHAVPVGVADRSEQENGAAGTVTDIGYLGTLSIYKVRLEGGSDTQGRGGECTSAMPRARSR